MGAKRTICPACGNDNYSIWDNGTAKCWNCGHWESNSNVEIKPPKRSRHVPEIRGFYSEIAQYYHECLGTEQRQWLYMRGVSDYSIKLLKIGYCPAERNFLYKTKIAKIAGIATKEDEPTSVLAGRITFPFAAEGVISDLWGRSLNTEDKIKYRGPNFPSYCRGSDHAYCHDYAYKPNAFARLVRTEGLIKAVVANQYGVPTVAYPGTMAWRSGTPPMQDQTQVIIFDNQVKHRRELKAAIKREAERYINPKIGTLPLRGGDKADLDSYIFEYGIDDFRRIVEKALDYEAWKCLVN